MGDFLNGMPYTNFHELNADWILKTVKALGTKVDELGETIETSSQKLEEVLTPELLAEALKILAVPASYVGPELDLVPDVTVAIPTSGVDTTLYTKLIAAYDELPLSKTVMGADEDGNSLIKYTWTANSYRRTNIADGSPTAENLRTNNNMANTLILNTGTHGNERQSVVSLLQVVKWALTSEDASASFIRDNYNLIILPCTNPWGYNNDNRLNKDGVDINRNFSPYWAASESTAKGSEPFDTAGAAYVRDVLLSIPANQRHATAFLDFHDFTGADGTYDPYNFMGAATYPDSKSVLLTLLVWLDSYLRRNELGVPKSARNIRFTNHAAAPTAAMYAWTLHFSYSTLLENRLYLNNSKYEYASAKLSALQLSMAVLLYARHLLTERTPTVVRRLADLNMTTGNTCAEISDAMWPGSQLSFYVTQGASGSVLAADMPTYDPETGDFTPGVLVINKPRSDGAITTYTFVKTFEASSPAIYYRFRVFNGYMSNWLEIVAG